MPEELEPLEVLYERGPLHYPLSSELRDLYGRGFGFDQPTVYANFVQSIDGVVALRSVHSPAPLISGGYAADRFVMALLRACADCVLVGAGTMSDTAQRWTAELVYPTLSDQFLRLRAELGMTPEPLLVLVTASGSVDVNHPALHAGAMVLTTAAGARRIGSSLPERCRLHSLSSGRDIEMATALAFLWAEGFRHILSEAGPNITGQLVEGGLLDELFLTIAPVLSGSGEGDGIGLLAGARFLPQRRQPAELISVRRHAGYLFLRYGVQARGQQE